MKIYQGIDIVELSRFKDVLHKNNNFIPDIFTAKERDYCLSQKEPDIHFAGRFAVKEAGMKALGMGISGIDRTFQEIETVPGASGKPLLSFYGWTRKVSDKRKINQLTVSISHAADYAVATVILTGQDNV